jgi:hypothetical protein
MTTIAPTARPNGKLYRPRKPLRTHAVSWNEDCTVVLVYGTHDADLAHDLAQAEWCREVDGREGNDSTLPEPQRIWTKLVPWDALGYGYDRTILQVSGDTKGSTPTLQYGGHL